MSRDLNQMEFRSILVATVTIYSGLYYLTGDLDEITKIFLFVVMVTANFYFLLYWCAKMLQAGIKIAKKKLPCLRSINEVTEKESDKNDDPLSL